MLESIHIKNFALISDEEIFFDKGLNILTGETGAGKSIIFGALGLALGDKFNKDSVKDENAETFIEAVFSVQDLKLKEKLEDLSVDMEDDQVILTRKISNQRSRSLINGENVPLKKLSKVGELLIDIYGQHEYQSLMKAQNHLSIIDDFGKSEIEPVKEKVKNIFDEWKKLQEELNKSYSDEKEREKELLYLDHEIEEIESANLKIGEDTELEDKFKKMNNFKRIMSSVNEAYEKTGDNGISSLISDAISDMKNAVNYDEALNDDFNILSDVESLINDFNHNIKDYIMDSSFDEEEFEFIEKRLDIINDLKSKYGFTIENILSSLSHKKKKKEEIENYDTYLENLKQNIKLVEKEYFKEAKKLSDFRKKYIDILLKDVKKSMEELNFSNTAISLPLEESETPLRNGIDSGEFLVSLNKGEPIRPLREVASGGELSRISLSIKTSVSNYSDIKTLIFDEIDAGISGRTAQRVAQKLAILGKKAQIICITHLPQIAVMADKHYVVEKIENNNSTVSFIKQLFNNDRVIEIGRLLSGDDITEITRDNAKEMLKNAENFKNS